MSDKRQKNQLVLAFTERVGVKLRGSPRKGPNRCGEARSESPANGEQLMEEVCERGNASRHWHESRPIKEVLAWTG